MAFSYFINRKKTTCVISIKGTLAPTDAETLEECLKKAVSEPAKYYILNLGGLKEVDPAAGRPFTMFQQGLRANSRLYVSDLLPVPGNVLTRGGILREGETFPDLMSCLQSILNAEKG